MLQERTREYIRNLSDAELWEYIQAGTERYEPEAIAFACNEFEGRKIDSEQIARIEAEVESRAAEAETERLEAAACHLGPVAKVMAFIGGCLGLPALLYLLIWYNFRTHGEHQKAQELWIYGFAGLATVLVFSVILYVVSAYLKFIR